MMSRLMRNPAAVGEGACKANCVKPTAKKTNLGRDSADVAGDKARGRIRRFQGQGREQNAVDLGRVESSTMAKQARGRVSSGRNSIKHLPVTSRIWPEPWPSHRRHALYLVGDLAGRSLICAAGVCTSPETHLGELGVGNMGSMQLVVEDAVLTLESVIKQARVRVSGSLWSAHGREHQDCT
jgi:hypothetical protein